MKKYRFICVFENACMEDPDIERFEAGSMDEAEEIAIRRSDHVTGRSLGNFDLYVDVMGVKPDGLEELE